jgi:hypothetical protein
MQINSEFWQLLRADFESLFRADFGDSPAHTHTFTLIWNSCPPLNHAGEVMDSQWTWLYPTNAGLRARFEAFALRGAKALGGDKADDWLDHLRNSDFVRIQMTGKTVHKGADGLLHSWEDGTLEDALKDSITLCQRLQSIYQAIGGRLHGGAQGLSSPVRREPEVAAGAENRPAVNSRRPVSEVFAQYRANNQQIQNDDDIAQKVNVCRDTIQRVKNEREWVRAETYKRLATLMGCAESNLHPRFIPKTTRKKFRPIRMSEDV